MGISTSYDEPMFDEEWAWGEIAWGLGVICLALQSEINGRVVG